MLFAPFGIQFRQLVHQFLVDVQRTAGVRQTADLDAALHFAAAGFGRHRFAQAAFQMAQVFGDFELHVEKAVVDRPQFQFDAFARIFSGRVRIAGHTEYCHVFSFAGAEKVAAS